MTSDGVQLFEVPLDPLTAGLMRVLEIRVPTERGTWCEVNVMHNLVRDTFEVEFSAEMLDRAPQAVTATVQLVMLAIRDWRVR